MSSEIRQTVSQAKAVHWLGRQLKLPFDYDLWGLLKTIRRGGSAQFYEPQVIRQSDEKHRRLFVPTPWLMALQHRINRYILNDLPRNPNAFGFRGGGCHELARRLSAAQAIFKCDTKDAFFQVDHGMVCHVLQERYRLSWNVAHFLADLCTYRGRDSGDRETRSFLPQGAPTSPKLFDLCCSRLDQRLGTKASHLGGVYVRYADNVYFGLPLETFPRRLRTAILREVESAGLGWEGTFTVHKVRVAEHGNLLRVLGLNLIAGQVTNTRRFKRKLRGALHHLRYVLEHGLPRDEALQKVKGLMAFAVQETLPQRLRGEFSSLLGNP